MKTFKVGIVGCGNIANAYFRGCKMFRILEVVACADIRPEAAKAKAEEHGVQACSVDEILKRDDIDIIINLTIPAAHAEVSLAALEAGKHVHSEKPLGLTLEEGRKIIETAKARNLRAGCAPDTFLGAGLQTCRKLISDGWIGKPIAGTAFMMGHGPEAWHPNPAFFYQVGGGPMFDMGPYYMTALIHLLGPAKSVSAVTAKTFEERIATCEQHFGEKLPVEVSTHNSGTIVFQNGAIITVAISFDIWKHSHRPIELYGTEGSLQVPDPNTFGGPVRTYRPEQGGDWQDVNLLYHYAENSRSIGVADMAHAILSGRPHRCDASLAYHALEIMHAFDLSSQTGKTVELQSSCEQPKPFPLGMIKGILDD